MNISRIEIEKAFADYTSNYNVADPKIKLKIDHTYRVANICERIAHSIGLDEDNIDLAWLSGMLHDIGRFEQVRQYGTFNDADSIDHAELGADLLFKENLLDKFVPDKSINLTKEEVEILEKSIRNHSLYRLNEGLSEKEIMFCNILRDADKVDIFKVNCDTPMEDIYNVTTEQLKKAHVTEEVKQSFIEKHAVLRAIKRTPIDNLVGHICLAFELVYPISLELVKEQGYLDKMLSFESDNPETREWFKYMKDNI